ncbi:MAG TPA: hypothetical protein VMI34_14735 [Candidatus Bathyarchaeia archaeon]|nr:hypothetical protein [Candidatus Bathyarchaeia archaeon]
MTSGQPGATKIETGTAGSAIHVAPDNGKVLLSIGEPGSEGCRTATLSPEQADMVLHALGLAVARIRETERVRALERAGLEERLFRQEIRFDER